jgi:YfiR/HmsC-like
MRECRVSRRIRLVDRFKAGGEPGMCSAAMGERRRKGSWSRRGFLALALGPCCRVARVWGQGRAGAVGEYEIKAAFLYNFAKFVEWPDQALVPGTPFTVGVVGDPDLADALQETMRGKNVRGHRFEVRHFAGPDDLQVCHMLFIGSVNKGDVQAILSVLRGTPVLTIAQVGDFTRLGGIIELSLENRKMGFEINAGVARKAGLKISSQLLKLARAVQEG